MLKRAENPKCEGCYAANIARMPVQYDNDLVRLLAARPLFSLMLMIHVGFAAADGQGAGAQQAYG